MNRFWVRQTALLTLILLFMFVPIGLSLRFALDDFIEADDTPEHVHQDGNIPPRLLGVMGVSLLLGGVVGVMGSRSLSQPINTLVEGVRDIGSGKLGHQVALKGASQELQELSTAINKMSIALSDAEAQRRRLMADVSHELRTPLTVLEGHLRAGLDDVYALDQAKIANLYGQTHHLIKLVDDLNLLANAEAQRLDLIIEMVDVCKVAQEVVDNFSLSADEDDITLNLDVDHVIRLIPLDIIRFRQILSNLVDNALRYTPSNGTITVHIQETKQGIHIEITDTGRGIDPEQLPYIFDRFYRTDESRSRHSGGSGLGLAIVKALVNLQGGTITVASDGEHMGTKFRISFPI